MLGFCQIYRYTNERRTLAQYSRMTRSFPLSVQAPRRLTTCGWLPRWIISFNSVAKASYSSSFDSSRQVFIRYCLYKYVFRAITSKLFRVIKSTLPRVEIPITNSLIQHGCKTNKIIQNFAMILVFGGKFENYRYY